MRRSSVSASSHVQAKGLAVATFSRVPDVGTEAVAITEPFQSHWLVYCFTIYGTLD